MYPCQLVVVGLRFWQENPEEKTKIGASDAFLEGSLQQFRVSQPMSREGNCLIHLFYTFDMLSE